MINTVLISVLACVLGFTYRDKPSWRGHSCDTGDNQRSSGVVIARSRSFGALDHQRRDLHFNRLTLPLGRSGLILYQILRPEIIPTGLNPSLPTEFSGNATCPANVISPEASE